MVRTPRKGLKLGNEREHGCLAQQGNVMLWSVRIGYPCYVLGRNQQFFLLPKLF